MDPIVATDPGGSPDSISSLASTRFAVVDLETSGLSIERNRLLQIGVVLVDVDGVVHDSWSSFVRPRWWPVARVGPTKIHGIRLRDLGTAPRLGPVFDKLNATAQGAVVVAHNLDFDWGFLTLAAGRSAHALPSGPRLCTLKLSRSLDPDRLRSHRLADLCCFYGVEHADPHRALSDAIATAHILPHLLRHAQVTTLNQLERLVER
jgi:DNA polymerase III epsilon subunit-like protein